MNMLAVMTLSLWERPKYLFRQDLATSYKGFIRESLQIYFKLLDPNLANVIQLAINNTNSDGK